MSIHADVLDLFNCLVVDERQKSDEPNMCWISRGAVLDFHPTPEQHDVLDVVLKALPVRTLFSREERENASSIELLTKQLFHYIEVYGLDSPGLFDLEVDNGKVVSLRYVHGITVNELEQKIQELLYANAPVKDAAQVQRIVEHYALSFDINKVANNELRVVLWHNGLAPFDNGDDAVRYLCAKATGSPLLIKSKEVIAAVAATSFPVSFFEAHASVLAQVFNRHKRIILAAKTKSTANVINRITRLSKIVHQPVHESIAKTFVHKALMGESGGGALKNVTVRDKMKYLNVLAQKRLQATTNFYRVRNGKVFYKENARTYDLPSIEHVEHMVLGSLARDLAHLKNQSILLDPNVDYGLPVSRKQTLGRLPFGTKITSAANEISSGMYWENAWGATDLDLSAVTLDGKRIGWGEMTGYADRGIIFSGDITSAPKGAMEFMTSRAKDYGIIVNIFSGQEGSEMELVVGRNTSKTQWIDEIIVRERHKLDSRNCLLGFVKGKTFTVFAGRMNNRRVSGTNPTLQAMEIDFWTVERLFNALDIQFDVDPQDEIVYDYDLSYEAFSFDKLEALLTNAA